MVHADEIVKPSDFFVPANRLIAEMIWNRWAMNKPIDIALIYSDLQKANKLDIIGGLEGLRRIADAMPLASNVKHYAEVVSEASQSRSLIEAAQQVIQLSYKQNLEITDLLSRCESVMGKALQQRQTRKHVLIADQVKEELAILTSEQTAKAPGNSTGFIDLDKKIAGLHKGDMTIVAGRPSMGKTSLALKIALNLALDSDLTVLIISLETSASQITRNFLSIKTKTSAHKMRSLSLDKKEKTQLVIGSASLFDTKIIIDENSDTLNKVRSVCRHLSIKHNLGLVVIDYLQLLSQEIKHKREEMEQISRSLKRLAKELNVPFIVISQLSRAVEHRGQKVSKNAANKYFKAGETVYMPRLSDLRESGAIEQDADNVLLLYRQDYYRYDKKDHDRIAHVKIAKQRQGPTDSLLMTFQPEYLLFSNYIQEDEDLELYEEFDNRGKEPEEDGLPFEE